MVVTLPGLAADLPNIVTMVVTLPGTISATTSTRFYSRLKSRSRIAKQAPVMGEPRTCGSPSVPVVQKVTPAPASAPVDAVGVAI